MKTKNKKHISKTETRYDTPDPLRPRRNGKIAALNRDTREALNRQLKVNHTTDDILSWLNAQPAVQAVLNQQFKGQAINRQNLAEWRMGGYRDWQNQECAFTWWEKKAREIAEKGGNPYQLGQEMAQIHAGQFLATLADLMATAPTAEIRMKQLSRAMVEFRGWRRADYHAERIALEKQNSQWRRERETQELALKERQLALNRDKHERNAAENIVNTCKNAKVRAAATRSDQWYGERVKGVTKIMFGDEEESPASEVQSPKSGEGLQGPGLANGEKTGVENQGLAGSDGVSSTQKDKPVSNMTDQERKAFYDLYLGMLLDLNAAGEDLREIGGFSDAEKKHEALKASLESKVQSPESEKKGKGEEEKAGIGDNIRQPTSNIQHPEKDGETPNSKLQTPNNLQQTTTNGPPPGDAQPSTKDTQPAAEGPMSVEQAKEVVGEWRKLVRSFGGYIVNHWDAADLIAYLSQQPAQYYSIKTFKLETRQPPARDPRHDPASPWCRAWKRIQQHWKANEKN